MTEPEVMLGSRLRGRGSEHPTFRRQHVIGSIIVDFFCPSARLAVEVDGSSHWGDGAQENDQARDAWLKGQGIEVLRIPASRVYVDLGGVVDGILWRADELILDRKSLERGLPPPPPALRRAVPLPPLRGGGNA